MKILWISDFLGDFSYPYPTGSGTLSYNIVTRLLDSKIDVVIVDPGISNHQNIITYSRKSMGRIYRYKGNEIEDIASRMKPTLIVSDNFDIASEMINSLYDCPPIILFARDIERIKHESSSLTIKESNIVSLSNNTKEYLKNNNTDSTYIPPGIDPEFFYPNSSSVEKIGTKSKRFVFGCVCKNNQNKNIIELLQSYKIFNDNFKDGSVLALHTNDNGYYNLDKICKHLGISENVFYGNFPVDIRDMNRIYNTFDVHINIGGSEWTGFSTLESLYCNIPNIVSDYGVLSEYVSSVNSTIESINDSPFKVKTTHDKIINDGSVINTVKTEDLSLKMEEMWLNEDLRQIDSSDLIPKYNWNTSTELFIDLLEKLS